MLITTATYETQMRSFPEVVRAAITSANIPEKLRNLNEEHQLHVDQWAILQDIVMSAVVGATSASNIPKELESRLHLVSEVAMSLALDINDGVFEPIREELERGLGAPAAKVVETTELETVRTQAIAQEKAVGGTPPPPAPTERAVRAPLSTTYAAGQPSHERKVADGDPYREPAV